MACSSCCGRARKQRKREPRNDVSVNAFDDVVPVRYIGDSEDVYYGVVSGIRYAVVPGDIVEADIADLVIEHPVKQGLLDNGRFEIAG